MVSASSSRASSRRAEDRSSVLPDHRVGRWASCMPSRLASCSMAISRACLLRGAAWCMGRGGARGSPGAAGAAGGGPAGAAAVLADRQRGVPARPGWARRRAAGVRPAVGVRLVPDRLRGPRAGRACTRGRSLARRGAARSAVPGRDDGQRDAREDEHGLDDGHGRQSTGRPRSPPARSHPSGCRCAHGRAASSCADSATQRRLVGRTADQHACRSAGRPPVQCSGTLTAGWPVTL